MAYYKVLIEVWCDFDPRKNDLKEIAGRATVHGAICTLQEVIRIVDRPQGIEDEEAMSFFGGIRGREFLLLRPLRKPWSTRKPPSRSSQSTMMASNFSVRRISWPELTPRQTSTSMDSFSRAGSRTRTTSASRLRSRDSNGIHSDGSFRLQLFKSDQGHPDWNTYKNKRFNPHPRRSMTTAITVTAENTAIKTAIRRSIRWLSSWLRGGFSSVAKSLLACSCKASLSMEPDSRSCLRGDDAADRR
jgi:hypothetical protein